MTTNVSALSGARQQGPPANISGAEPAASATGPHWVPTVPGPGSPAPGSPAPTAPPEAPPLRGASPPRLQSAGNAWISAATPPALGVGPQSSDGVEMDPAARPVAVSARPQRPIGRASCSASPHRPKPAGDAQISAARPPALGVDLQLSGGVGAIRPLLELVASVWTRSPPTVWVEVLLLGRQPSARGRRDPLVVLASLFGNRPAVCGARRPGRQLSGRWKRRRDPDTGGKMSGVAKQRPEIQSNHAQIDRCHCA
ncbi:hypothetical protein NQZ68_008666 [Dissostichus eleginoides]|nr:hypothetical protein NQZ68_008666 [Dissostichus eleginoides]